MILEDKIEAVFGSCFSTHGLGGVLTCGVIGMGAGLSHSPVENVSTERAELLLQDPGALDVALGAELCGVCHSKHDLVYFSSPAKGFCYAL
jgi:hypothetical protein